MTPIWLSASGAPSGTAGHPHVLPLYDSWGAGDVLFHVMPLVEGDSPLDTASGFRLPAPRDRIAYRIDYGVQHTLYNHPGAHELPDKPELCLELPNSHLSPLTSHLSPLTLISLSSEVQPFCPAQMSASTRSKFPPNTPRISASEYFRRMRPSVRSNIRFGWSSPSMSIFSRNA